MPTTINGWTVPTYDEAFRSGTNMTTRRGYLRRFGVPVDRQALGEAIRVPARVRRKIWVEKLLVRALELAKAELIKIAQSEMDPPPPPLDSTTIEARGYAGEGWLYHTGSLFAGTRAEVIQGLPPHVAAAHLVTGPGRTSHASGGSSPFGSPAFDYGGVIHIATQGAVIRVTDPESIRKMLVFLHAVMRTGEQYSQMWRELTATGETEPKREIVIVVPPRHVVLPENIHQIIVRHIIGWVVPELSKMLEKTVRVIASQPWDAALPSNVEAAIGGA